MAIVKTGGTSRSRRRPKSVRVWGEAGITLAVTSDPPQFVRVSFGHERIAPDDSEATIKRYEKMVNDYNEDVVERRARKLVRMIKRVNKE